jgi:hypothetical protein
MRAVACLLSKGLGWPLEIINFREAKIFPCFFVHSYNIHYNNHKILDFTAFTYHKHMQIQTHIH